VRDALEALLEPVWPDAGQRRRLAEYGALLAERNAVMNLTSARDPASLAGHIADALTIARFIDGPLIDVGSGGGLPGIPLAIVCGTPVTLLESVMKKARFLEEALAALGIEGAVVTERAEAAAHEPRLRGQFARATARAVGSLSTVLELTLPFLATGGMAVLQRGAIDDAERDAAADAASMLGGAVEAVEDVGPGRRVLLVRKTGPTAGRFPRRTGVPAQRPLRMPRARARAAP
jgi:16S rRNA (guanine527-N7)-methyltransferase